MKVLIIDDDALVSMSLKKIIESTQEIEVVEIGFNGADAIRLYELYKPDVLLMDIRMEGMNGLDAAEIILNSDQNAKILMLTTFSDDEYIIKALKIGVKGFILKQHFQSIIPALKTISLGQSVFGDEILLKIPALMSNDKKTDYSDLDISEKEYQIIQLVAEGLSNKEIADSIYLSEGTVRNYISNILLKLDLRDRTQLAIFYYKNK